MLDAMQESSYQNGHKQARLANRVQLTTDGHKAYLEAVEGAFGADVDYAQLVKLYGSVGGNGTVYLDKAPLTCDFSSVALPRDPRLSPYQGPP